MSSTLATAWTFLIIFSFALAQTFTYCMWNCDGFVLLTLGICWLQAQIRHVSCPAKYLTRVRWRTFFWECFSNWTNRHRRSDNKNYLMFLAELMSLSYWHFIIGTWPRSSMNINRLRQHWSSSNETDTVIKYNQANVKCLLFVDVVKFKMNRLTINDNSKYLNYRSALLFGGWYQMSILTLSLDCN